MAIMIEYSDNEEQFINDLNYDEDCKPDQKDVLGELQEEPLDSESLIQTKN